MSLNLTTLKDFEDTLIIFNSVNGQVESFFNWESFLLALENIGLDLNDLHSKFSEDELTDFFFDKDINFDEETIYNVYKGTNILK